MTATYTNQPGTVDVDTVRLETDDKDTDNPLLTDEEIQYYIDSNSHILLAAASAAEGIASKYSDSPSSKSVGDLKLTYDQGRAVTYGEMAANLRARAYRKAGANIYAGGVSKSDKDAAKADTDRVQPVFTIGMDDAKGSGGQDTDRGIIDY
jgi:hypothetical protein